MTDPVVHRAVHLLHPEHHRPGYELPASAAPPPTRGQLVVGFALSVAVAWLGFVLEHRYHDVPDARVSAAWVMPFAVLLAAIATMPFIAKHFWERHYNKVAVGLGVLVAAYYLAAVENGPGNVGRSVAEYISFIFLLASLFVVSGGILIRVRARATPLANVTLLLIGAVLANVFGTTGASMLLIRPYLRMNKGHLRPYHVVFFVFVVSNAGGCLTPIGDPPLFLGYLTGVPFFWVFEHCWPIWVTVNGLLLAIFFVFDVRTYRGEDRRPYQGADLGPAVSLYGATNLPLAGLIVAGILLHGPINAWTHGHLGFGGPWREIGMAVAAFASLATTPQRVHGGNVFNYGPIKEVAYLFAGIFLTMVPALNYLGHHADALRLTRPGQYYFATGGLSSVLDNAPTYLTILKTELAGLDVTEADRAAHGGLSDAALRVRLLIGDERRNLDLVAISMGAVLFGAMTYIGNGPNFMVKSIADFAGAPTPGFFRYVYAFAVPVLLPVLVVVWWLFLRSVEGVTP